MNQYLALIVLAALGGFIYLLAPILTPFAAGALIAYLTDPLADRLETFGLKRISAVGIVFGLIVLIVILMLFIIIPLIQEQIGGFIDDFPIYSSRLRAVVLPWLHSIFGSRLRIPDLAGLTGMISSHWQQAGGIAATIISQLGHSGGILVSWLLNLLLTPVVIFYLLRDWDILVARFHELLPRKWSGKAKQLANDVDEVLSAVFRGQLMVMLALGTIYSVGLWLVGLNQGLLIGILSGTISFIPYAGALVGFMIAAVAAIAQFGDFHPVAWVALVFGVGQMLEGMVLTPNLIGGKAGLHPVAVIFAVLAGGQLFGFLGVLLALPLASVVMVFLRHIHEIYKDSDLYGRDTPSRTNPKEDPGYK